MRMSGNKMRRASAVTLAAAAAAGCGAASGGSSTPGTVTVSIAAPSGARFTTTVKRVEDRRGTQLITGLCGTLRSSGAPEAAADFCGYTTPGKRVGAADAFLGSNTQDVLITAVLPEADFALSFVPDRGAPISGRRVAVPGMSEPAFVLLALRRDGLSGRIVATRGHTRLVSQRITAAECSAAHGSPRTCSIDLKLTDADAPSG